VLPNGRWASGGEQRRLGTLLAVSAVPAVEVDQLVVRYGDLTAVDGLSFTAEAGAVTAVLGPNGAGKTSTLEVCEGYRVPASGSVRVLGLDPQRDHAALVEQLGVMLQRGGVYPGIRVREVVALFCSFYRGGADPDALVEEVGLAERARSTWRQLSGGEQQRLSLALALAGAPKVAFLDEPTASVDVAGRQRVRELIRRLAAGGCCVVLSTHELEEAERLADRVVIVDHGRIVASGTPGELMRSMRAAELRFGARPGLDAAGLGATLGALVTEVSAGEYLVDTEPSPQVVATLTAWLADRDIPLADLRAGRKRLEDVYLALTAETAEAAAARLARRPGRARASRRADRDAERDRRRR
jgi:ABC-2 type transport system ATP-binding protein